MRPIHLVAIGTKTRPALVLTREVAVSFLTTVVVAPITTTVRGLSSEVAVGQANGLDQESAVSLDNVTAVRAVQLGRVVGYLLPEQEEDLARAVRAAFALVPWA